MSHPSDRFSPEQEPFLASAQEIATATLAQIGGDLGSLKLKELLIHGIHEGIQFGLGVADLQDDPIPEARAPFSADPDGVVTPIERGKEIKQARKERERW